MDYETKIYLDKLVEAVDKLDGPDLWIIVLTIINIGAFLFVAWTQIKIQKHQTKLQEKQIKQQEYEIYRSLYKLVRTANLQIDKFLDVLWEVVWEVSYKYESDFLKNRATEIKKLYDELNEHVTDYELKFSRDFFDNKAYYNILDLMTRIYEDIKWADKNNRINYVQGMQRDYRRSKNKDAELIEAISRRFNGDMLQSCMESSLKAFVELKKSVYNDDVLDKIRQRCKID